MPSLKAFYISIIPFLDLQVILKIALTLIGLGVNFLFNSILNSSSTFGSSFKGPIISSNSKIAL